MVRSKGTVQAAPGTAEFRKQAYEESTHQPLSESEVRELTDQKRELETAVSQAQEAGPGSSRAGSIDIMKAKAKIQHIANTIDTRKVEPVHGVAKDKLFKEENDLVDKLTRGMPTTYEMDRPAKNPGAVDKHLNWLKRNDANIKRWVEIQNQKGPNEERRYLDSLRREK